MHIVVPRGWRAVEVTTPKLLSCDRCDGGGCDGCDRRGAFRAPADEKARRLSLTLPSHQGDGLVLRLPQPFVDHTVEQLMVRVTYGEAPSAGVRDRGVRAIGKVTQDSIKPWWVLLAALLLIVAFMLIRQL